MESKGGSIVTITETKNTVGKTRLETGVECPGPAVAGGTISIRNVTKVYDPDGANVLALDDCSMEIGAGEFCVIVGPSGCGKTTLLNAIAGFHDISSGEIYLDGELLCSAKKTAEPGSDRIVVFQQGALFPWYTILENVTYGPTVQGRMSKKEAQSAAAEILEQVGLKDICHNYPSEISSGMRRRAEIARAMINDPRVLLMDEPYRAMDALTKTVMHKHLLDVYDASCKTVFFITHDLEEAIFLGNRVYVMTSRPGRIKKIIDVDIPRPRDFRVLSSDRYLSLKEEAIEAVHEEAKKAFEAGERELA
jgi:NitT/TauT family transport system ATP-binding protein